MEKGKSIRNEEINTFIREYKNIDDQQFDFYYIIPFIWLKRWDEFICGINCTYPDVINNSCLLEIDDTIKVNLVENIDFVILNKAIALYLFDKYGVKKK